MAIVGWAGTALLVAAYALLGVRDVPDSRP